jgi:hypothetical protein
MSRSPILLTLAAGVLLACGGDGPTTPAHLTLADLVGTYLEIEYKFTNELDANQHEDLVRDQGFQFALTIGARGSYTYTVTSPGGSPFAFSGALRLEGDTLYYDEDSTFATVSAFRFSRDTLYQLTRFENHDFGNDSSTATFPVILSEVGVRGRAGVTGYWVGTIQSSLIPPPGTGISFTLNQTGTSVTGGYFVPATGSFGDVAGTVSGNRITFTLTQNNASCPGSFSGTATVNGDTMTFTYTGNDCLGSHTNGLGSATRE